MPCYTSGQFTPILTTIDSSMLDTFLGNIISKRESGPTTVTPNDFSVSIESLREKAVSIYPDIRRADDNKAAGNISDVDAYILYTLVAHFKPNTVFEIGTWIGTSSMVMSQALQESGNLTGHIYTCDKNSYYSLGENYDTKITRINEYSDIALEGIEEEKSIDMVFADGELDYPTLKKMLPRLSKNAIIVTHDYTRPGEKGVRNLIRLQMSTRAKYAYVLPSSTDKIVSSIGILLPISLAQDLKLNVSHRLTRYVYTIYLFFTTHIYLFIRRVYRKTKSLLIK